MFLNTENSGTGTNVYQGEITTLINVVMNIKSVVNAVLTECQRKTQSEINPSYLPVHHRYAALLAGSHVARNI